MRGAALVALNVSLWTAAAHATPADCSERLLPPAPAAAGQRAVHARDLVELRDFGRLDDGPAQAGFALAPDGRHAALMLRRADAEADDYCFGVVLVTIDKSAPPRLLDTGGKPLVAAADMHGLAAIPAGVFRDTTPAWSPDGRSLAYLRRDGDVTQVWRVGLDGRPAQPLTALATEPLGLRWTADGRGILVTTRQGIDAARAAIARESRSGYHYDTRFWSLADATPQPRLPIATEHSLLDLVTGTLRSLDESEGARLAGTSSQAGSTGATLVAEDGHGKRAWYGPARASHPTGGTLLRLETNGAALSCVVALCREPINGLWWDKPGELLILRGGSAANGGRTALFRWRVGSGRPPRRLFETADWLPACFRGGSELICARESATRPRTLVRLDPGTGQSVTLYDPNPELAGLQLGKVQRLRWTDRTGVATYGDLVLPPSHRPGERHPLVVVQYLSRGFLRGGMGDEYPIHLFAARGFAVLSFQMPANAPEVDAEPDWHARHRLKIRNWAGRRRMFTALDAGIDAAVATGTVDPARIGITGMSDGSSTVQFALLHSDRFKAAAVSTCCDDPGAAFVVGPSYGASARAWGYPAAGEDGRAFWREQSLALAADRLRVPLLMQLPDGEFRMAAEAIAALEAKNAPVEAYVFADEWHTKRHPAHRLAIYRRNLAWFDFWLRDVETPGRSDELARWRSLRRR